MISKYKFRFHKSNGIDSIISLESDVAHTPSFFKRHADKLFLEQIKNYGKLKDDNKMITGIIYGFSKIGIKGKVDYTIERDDILLTTSAEIDILTTVYPTNKKAKLEILRLKGILKQ